MSGATTQKEVDTSTATPPDSEESSAAETQDKAADLIDAKIAEVFPDDYVPESETPADANDEPGSEEAEPTAKETPSKKEASEATAASALTPIQRDMIKRFDLSEDDLADMPMEAQQRLADKLHGRHNDFSTRLASLGRAAAAGEAPPDESAPPPADEAQPGAEEPETPAAAATAKPVDQLSDDEVLARYEIPGADDLAEELDPDAVATLVPIMAKLARATAKMEDRISHADETEKVRRNIVRDVDGFFDKVGEEYPDQYGVGTDRAVTDEQWAFRDTIVKAADKLWDNAVKAGMPITIIESLESAHALQLKDVIIDKAHEAGRRQGKKTRNQTMHPPGSRASTTPEDSDAAPEKSEELTKERMAETAAKHEGLDAWMHD